MPTCRICLQRFETLCFPSARVCICGRCTNDVNKYGQVAESAYEEARELLMRGVLRRAQRDLSTNRPAWIREKATRILEDPSGETERGLSEWINRLVADSSNRTKMFKIIRAHRRGLLHLDRPHRWGYPNNWPELAKKIRALDRFTCIACLASGVELHVHHIVYLSNFGAHQRANLVALCRGCHEREHKRTLDFGENMTNPDLQPES